MFALILSACIPKTEIRMPLKSIWLGQRVGNLPHAADLLALPIAEA